MSRCYCKIIYTNSAFGLCAADSFCEIWLIARHKFFNTELKVYNNMVGFSFDVVKAIGEEESGTLLNVANRLKMLDLSEEEAALMVAFVIFFSGKCTRMCVGYTSI